MHADFQTLEKIDRDSTGKLRKIISHVPVNLHEAFDKSIWLLDLLRRPRKGVALRTMFKVSIIVSTYSKDRLCYVIDCIEALKRQSLTPKEIILVLDPDQSLMEDCKAKIPDDVKIVINGKCGLSNARNTGIRNAKGEIVAFIDDDAVASENWLKNLNVVGVGGFIKPLWETVRLEWFPEELNWIVGCSYKGLPEHKVSVRNPIGCNMSFRRNIFWASSASSICVTSFSEKF